MRCKYSVALSSVRPTGRACYKLDYSCINIRDNTPRHWTHGGKASTKSFAAKTAKKDE